MNAVAQALTAGDVGWLRRFWRQAFPHLPSPQGDAETTVAMHHARTVAESVPIAKRLYSHAWLEERGLPSGLPDEMRPVRQESRIVRAVGVAARGPYSRLPNDEAVELERVMADAGGAAILAGAGDAEVRQVMQNARAKLGLRRIGWP